MSSSFMKEVDARTNLAGANQMELLLFDVGTVETFGINVFKVREVMKLLPVVRVPTEPRLPDPSALFAPLSDPWSGDPRR